MEIDKLEKETYVSFGGWFSTFILNAQDSQPLVGLTSP